MFSTRRLLADPLTLKTAETSWSFLFYSLFSPGFYRPSRLILSKRRLTLALCAPSCSTSARRSTYGPSFSSPRAESSCDVKCLRNDEVDTPEYCFAYLRDRKSQVRARG